MVILNAKVKSKGTGAGFGAIQSLMSTAFQDAAYKTRVKMKKENGHIFIADDNLQEDIFDFPFMPASVQINDTAKYQTYYILSKGTVMVPKGMMAGTISFRGTFFGKERNTISRESLLGGREIKYSTPKKCKKVLSEWMKKGKVLRLYVGGSFNVLVTIQALNMEEVGAFGDLNYSISFIKHTKLQINTSGTNTGGNDKKDSKSTSGKTHTIVKGDSLWKIAEKYLGKGSRHPEIYKLNKDAIEKDAKRHKLKSSQNGDRIFEGLKIKIP